MQRKGNVSGKPKKSSGFLGPKKLLLFLALVFIYAEVAQRQLREPAAISFSRKKQKASYHGFESRPPLDTALRGNAAL